MRKLFLIFVWLPAIAFAQKGKDKFFSILPEVDGVVMYTGVVQVDSTITKTELFNRAKAWFVTEYKSANDVIQMEDKEAGVIMGKGFAEADYKANFMAVNYANIYHTVKVYVKDGRYKYEITDLTGKFKAETGFNDIDIDNVIPVYNKPRKEKIITSANAKMLSIIESLKKGMSKPITTKDF